MTITYADGVSDSKQNNSFGLWACIEQLYFIILLQQCTSNIIILHQNAKGNQELKKIYINQI